jgi:hypothetical protein
MNEQMILQIIVSMVNVDARIVITRHARERMEERNIGYDDVLQILSNPRYVKKETESSQYHGKYNYRMVGKNEWSIVVSVYYPNKLIVVTVID